MRKQQLILLAIAIYIILTIWFAENRAEMVFKRCYPDCMQEMKQLQIHREDIVNPQDSCKAVAYREARIARIVVMGTSFLLIMPLLSWAYTRKFEKEVT